MTPTREVCLTSTDEQIANKLGIGTSSFYDYKNKYSEFSEALKKGKDIIDYQVEKALLSKALKGDTTAIIFWLKNRRPDKWRDRKEHSEIDIAQKELELKTKKLMLEEQKFNDESKDEAIKIQIVKASDRVCKK